VKKLVQMRNSERHALTAARSRRQQGRPQEEGYILLTLLLVVALMAIFAAGVIIPIKFEIQRDQEQEMIHRGVQYTRAIKAYYGKNKRYPTKLDDLDSTNNMRYLRKHYKDPLNKNQDFRLLHYGDPGVTLGAGLAIGGGSIPGATAVGSAAGANGSGFGGNSAFGGSSIGGSGFGGSGFGGANSSGVNSSGVFAQTSGSGGNSNSGVGGSSNSQTGSGQQGTNSAPGSDATQPSSPGTGQGSDSSSGQQLVSGGPIVGVASLSKNTTIREFNKKKKYNEWQFMYDPTTDRGGLITTPYQPALASFGAPAGLNGAQPAGANTSPFGGTNNGTGSSPFGGSNSSSFGQPSGFGNNANSGGSSQPSQPPPNPPQQ
jgi:type II secretory pathway pseudopilin PulG